MEGHAKKCVERYCQLANKTTQQLYKISAPCIDDHHFKEEELKSVGELSKVCSQIVLKCLYLARIGRPDILWSVNKLARSITKGTKTCDKRLSRLFSYIHHTMWIETVLFCGNTAKQCRLGLFQDSDFAGDLEDSKSTSCAKFVRFWKSYICSNKVDVRETNFSFTQFNRIRNHGLRLDGIPLLIYVIWLFQSLETQLRNHDRTGKPVVCRDKNHERQQSRGAINVLDHVDLVPQTSNFRIKKLCCMCLMRTKQWSRWS